MAEPDIHPQRRSSSQASSASGRSQKARTLRHKTQKRHSASSNATTDLTSFPSLSPPDRSPTLTRGLTNTMMTGNEGGDSASETGRGRKATLASLTSGLSQTSGRGALFADSVPPRDIPGALHLADDGHIERLIATTGAVKIVRQFARDLAQRDAEISSLRQRADARERELKRMLREVSVSNQDIERRLYKLENPTDDRNSDGESSASGEHGGLNGLMSQAMTDTVGSQNDADQDVSSDLHATIRAAQRSENENRSDGAPSTESSNTRRRQGSLRGWQEYLFGSTNASRKTSRASSIMSDMHEVEEEDSAERVRVPSNPSVRRKALDDQLFQPPGAAVSEILNRRLASGSTAADDASVHSRKSSRSLGSWTVKLFAGNAQAKDAASDSETSRNRAASDNQDKDKSAGSTLSGGAVSKSGLSAVAALKRINSNSNVATSGGRTASGSGTVKINPQRRNPASIVPQGATVENTDRSSTNLGPVEMDAILPLESRPPTLTPIYNNSQPGEFLTDRFGFIYDQRRKKRQREANAVKGHKSRLSIAETLGNHRADSDVEDDAQASPTPQQTVDTPGSGPGSPDDDPENGGVGMRRWQDYLRKPSRPTELLSHTPSAGPIISLTTAGENRPQNSSVSVDKAGAVSVGSSAQPSASFSAVTADRPEFAGTISEESDIAASAGISAAETEPVKLLLEQLTDLHDSLQRDRTVRWNEFLRKVRAERRKEGEAAAAAAAADRSVTVVDTPEASLADGEVIGIAGLGNKGKVGRAKWREFRLLVLGGIPVALRAKVWSECSGASAMRIPGYYEDLSRGIGGTEPDPSVIAQIDMDIRRTLTDNVFFRKGPGVGKLKEVLLAYSRRNPEVGYCQGMNLIAASLLLIMPTAEDAFWILTSMIEIILPHHYYDHGLLASRADQVVLRQYISELLPKLSAHLEDLGIELEALTFQWFLSIFTDCLSAEALYRVWDVVLCLNVTSASTVSAGPAPATNSSASSVKDGTDKATLPTEELASGSGGGSTFLFQVALALLKLNEPQLLTTCTTPAALYTYINHQMTNHAISIDGLIQASEALRNMVRREDVVARRAIALQEIA
ncbi:putative TBC domain protein [Penicillium brasilianum]|uniref:Putative TBC domain protein n=1 Tax=Penicillium brasilianum TaxID=104259 RepID=A0A1S9RUB4_PENBI|nr:putative TBC domain protein [Penicillium brasilianum]